MDTTVRTSFIPNTSLRPPEKGKQGTNFFTLLCLLVLIISILGWSAAYAYRVLTQKEVTSLELSLTRARESFDPSLLKVFENLDRRLGAAETLLAGHTSLVPFFETLDRLTLKSVRFNQFSYVTSEGAVAVRMSGEALDFPSIALQALQFGTDGHFQNPIFSNLDVSDLGVVTFDVSFNLDPNLVLYANQISKLP